MQTARFLSAGPLTGPGGGLFGPVQRSRALVALLLVGCATSIVSAVLNGAEERWTLMAVELVLLAGKATGVVWAARTGGRNEVGVNLLIAYNTVCTGATNVMFPGETRPFSAQLVLAMVLIALFLGRRAFTVQGALIALAAVTTVIHVDELGAQLARLATLVLTAAATAAMCRTVRTHYDRATAQASLDPLTGIGNRRAYDDQARSAIAHAERFAEPLALLYVDLDGFKKLNDDAGHEAGDAELAEVARRLTARARVQDGVFRIGGDEFALLLPGTDADGAAHLAHELIVRVTPGLRVGMTVGVAAFPLHADHAGGLLRAADAALLRGKRTAKGGIVVAPAPDETPAG
ncbi:MAG TPA: GGDEF domain-containing protein [Solirubrobacteraceae bacterium]|nr:GGDEF domain-containing protein [Solirubrobacteraceae bacterium]